MRTLLLSIILVGLNLWGFSQSMPTVKLTKQTPESGTKLSCSSLFWVKKVNKTIATSNPDSIFDHYKHKLPKSILLPRHYTDIKIGKDSLPTRIFYPTKKVKKHPNKHNLPVLVFFHGGGFIWGSLDLFHKLAHKLSKKLNCIVVLPAYRLAPEHPFPTPLNDCNKVIDWVFENISTQGGDPKKVGLIGDSAGANLALVSSLKNKQKAQPYPIRFQVLYYPTTTMVDTTFASRTYFAGEKGAWYVLNKPLLEYVKASYLKTTPDTCWEVSPLYANYDSSFPPTFIATAQCDPLRDEGEALALKMKNSGANITHIRYNKTVHGFVSLYPLLKQGRKALRATKRFVKSVLEP